jgi:hypothetical protein
VHGQRERDACPQQRRKRRRTVRRAAAPHEVELLLDASDQRCPVRSCRQIHISPREKFTKYSHSEAM